MAKLSTRINPVETGKPCEEDYLLTAVTREYCFIENDQNTLKNTQENTNMNNTLRELTATLIDNNPFLKDEQRIVFKKINILTSASYEDVKLDIIATGDVMPALKEHNEQVRASTIREDILDNRS